MLTSKVMTNYGCVGGVAAFGCLVYRGIPYARADRFMPPSPPEAWTGVFAADRFGPRGYQRDLSDMPLYGKEFYSLPEFAPVFGEDCLRLNIWTPAKKGNYPVMVWIHGGSFDHGYSYEMEFDGAEYAKRGVILVTVGYRLGALGLLCHPLLEKQGVKGNLALLDLISALEWIRENISYFGGDRDNVTLAGQSAGSILALCLACSPKAKNLFRRAIFQSGRGYKNGLPGDMSYSAALAKGKEFLEYCGISSREDLMKIPAEALTNMRGEFSAEKGGIIFAPVADGDILPYEPDIAIEKGALQKLSFIAGYTKDDISPAEGTPSPIPEGAAALCAARGGKEKRYLYRFGRDLPGDNSGAFHSSELWYTFGTLGRSWRPVEERDQNISRRMLDCWTSFAKTGDPEGGWLPYDEKSGFTKNFQ